MKHTFYLILSLILTSHQIAIGQSTSKVWTPDQGKGKFINPIIHADYSDPDICRVGEDFYMTSSSFNSMPGLPILHSKDLVNWQLINHALPTGIDNYFDIVQHGNGVWAPCIRYHEGLYYIYWGDPDRGIFMVQTSDPKTDWTAPVLVKKAYGNIDPSPLWDDDGKVYMVHAFAHSRAGVKSLLQVVELSADGSHILDKGKIVFDGHQDHPTIEGPKLYKRNGYYYIFAPGGGVPTGWQTILRSKNIYGPYESKIVLSQGNTPINGPHQGGWIELDNGENWFIHFQDRGPYGRITHLQPVQWINDWPIMGEDPDGDDNGQPVMSFSNMLTKKSTKVNPKDSDEFDVEKLGLQWQWNANPKPNYISLSANPGKLRMNMINNKLPNLWMAPNMLCQKLPADEFMITTKIDISHLKASEEIGLVVFGLNYSSLILQRNNESTSIAQKNCINADQGSSPNIIASSLIDQDLIWLRATITSDSSANFSYSQNGKSFTRIGSKFKMKEGKWVGSKIALYGIRTESKGIPGYAELDWFRFNKIE
ncbi:MAG: glycoside hydrolase 43 family protein [Reichenbachiella sp.]